MAFVPLMERLLGTKIFQVWLLSRLREKFPGITAEQLESTGDLGTEGPTFKTEAQSLEPKKFLGPQGLSPQIPQISEAIPSPLGVHRRFTRSIFLGGSAESGFPGSVKTHLEAFILKARVLGLQGIGV